MPRTPRLEVPGIPLHITHRGVNRCAVFIDDVDRGTYLHLFGEQFLAQQVALHAYVLNRPVACRNLGRPRKDGA